MAEHASANGSKRLWIAGGIATGIAAIGTLVMVLLVFASDSLLGPSGWQELEIETLRPDSDAARLSGFVEIEQGYVTGFQDRVYLLIGQTALDAAAAGEAFAAAGFERVAPGTPDGQFAPGTIEDVPEWRVVPNALRFTARRDVGSGTGIAFHEAWLEPDTGKVFVLIAEM